VEQQTQRIDENMPFFAADPLACVTRLQSLQKDQALRQARAIVSSTRRSAKALGAKTTVPAFHRHVSPAAMRAMPISSALETS
jgi:hypothetical protein